MTGSQEVGSMRYVLAGLTVVIVALAVGALVRTNAWDPASAGTPEVPTESTPSALTVPHVVPTLARVQIPYTRLLEQAVSRDRAIEVGRGAPARMGEENPELIDATLLPVDETRRRLGLDGGGTGLPEDALVWVVRMWGTFMPSSAPGPEQMVPEEGWAYSVVNAKTGATMGHGHRNPDTPF
jgi:hypothetical protein